MYEFDYQSKGGEKEEEANVREEEESEKGKDEREDVEMQELCDMYNNKLEFGKKKKITNLINQTSRSFLGLIIELNITATILLYQKKRQKV